MFYSYCCRLIIYRYCFIIRHFNYEIIYLLLFLFIDMIIGVDRFMDDDDLDLKEKRDYTLLYSNLLFIILALLTI